MDFLLCGNPPAFFSFVSPYQSRHVQPDDIYIHLNKTSRRGGEARRQRRSGEFAHEAVGNPDGFISTGLSNV